MALSEAVDKEMPKWTDAKPKTEVKAGKVSDTGSHEMENAEANYSSVSATGGAKKIETKPAFSSVKDPGSNGGATGVKGSGKAKEVKLKESVEITEAFDNDANSITVDLDFVRDQLFNDTTIPEELIETIMGHIQAGDVSLVESTRNQRMLTTGSPALKEDESVAMMESKLSAADKAKAARLRETIEMITGKKVTYKA